MKKLRNIQWIVLLIAIFSIQSCVDDKYDLSKLPDHVILAGDSIILPMGSTDTAFMKSFIDDKHLSYIENRNGVYVLVQKDSIELSLPSSEDLKVDNASVSSSQSAKVSYIPTGIQVILPKDEVFAEIVSSKTLPVNTGSTISRLDFVEFNNEGNNAALNLNIDLRQTNASGPCDISFIMEIPSGLELIPDAGNGVVVANQYILHITDLSLFPVNRTFKIKKLDQSGGNPIVFSYKSTITLKQGASITYTGNDPGLDISMATSNMYVNYLKGKINFSGSKPGITANISDLYSLFKSNNDIVSLYNPALYIESVADFGVPLTISLKSSAVKNNSIIKQDNTELNIVAPTVINESRTNKFALSNLKPSGIGSDVNWSILDLKGYIKLKPDVLNADIDFASTVGTGTIANPHFMSSTSKAKVNYRFELPLAFDSDFLLNFNDTVMDVFTDDKIKEYFFSTGSVVIAGTFTSTIPMNANLTAAVLSKDFTETPVTIQSTVKIDADTKGIKIDTPFSLILTAEDMKTMNFPRHLALYVKLDAGNDINGTSLAGIPLKSTDYIVIKNLRVIKKGGIQISTK
ncbi:MAG: DUF4621 domain-containing protein [Bacteroidales bacterium]|nr:DUF4621 domain-containing protein [Bacteroidales bacterium]